jgi:hypothetical protein
MNGTHGRAFSAFSAKIPQVADHQHRRDRRNSCDDSGLHDASLN